MRKSPQKLSRFVRYSNLHLWHFKETRLSTLTHVRQNSIKICTRVLKSLYRSTENSMTCSDHKYCAMECRECRPETTVYSLNPESHEVLLKNSIFVLVYEYLPREGSVPFICGVGAVEDYRYVTLRATAFVFAPMNGHQCTPYCNFLFSDCTILDLSWTVPSCFWTSGEKGIRLQKYNFNITKSEILT